MVGLASISIAVLAPGGFFTLAHARWRVMALAPMQRKKVRTSRA